MTRPILMPFSPSEAAFVLDLLRTADDCRPALTAYDGLSAAIVLAGYRIEDEGERTKVIAKSENQAQSFLEVVR